jgi:hypothetical protein
MSEKDQKGEMSGGGTFEFFVVNLTTKPLTGTVTWSGGSRKVPLDVNGLQYGATIWVRGARQSGWRSAVAAGR